MKSLVRLNNQFYSEFIAYSGIFVISSQPGSKLLFHNTIIFPADDLDGLAGFGFGLLSKYVINGINLHFEGLYPVLVIVLMFITFAISDFVGGNGFLAIYICAVYLGNQDLIHKSTIMKMFDGTI